MPILASSAPEKLRVWATPGALNPSQECGWAARAVWGAVRALGWAHGSWSQPCTRSQSTQKVVCRSPWRMVCLGSRNTRIVT
eukprot:3115080-Prymnesium_polylepis.1